MPTTTKVMDHGGREREIVYRSLEDNMKPLCIGNGQTNQPPSEVVGALNCMHDQQAVITWTGGV